MNFLTTLTRLAGISTALLGLWHLAHAQTLSAAVAVSLATASTVYLTVDSYRRRP